MDKKEIRKNVLKDRKNKNNIISSNKVINEIISSNILDKYNNIGIYYPIGNEINVMELLNIYKDKKFYLPITKDEISFASYKIGDELVDGPFNTKEPKGNIVKRDLIDCFIIPCVAISKDKRRLGYGKGYYDRYLANYNGLKIGICYKEHANLDVVLNDYDVCLDKIILG